MSRITTKKFLKYTLTPEVVPRVRKLFNGFTYIAFFLAQIYRAVGLLPAGHEYLQSANMGRFGLRHVIAEAGIRLKQQDIKTHFDRYAIYWLLMTGLVILFAQFCLLIIGAFSGTSFAQETAEATNYFVTQNPTHDIAFMLLDRVFGVPDLFNSCVAQSTICFDDAELAAGEYWTDTARSSKANVPFPYPFHEALRAVMQLYSIALLVIALVILIYFIGAIAAETAETGTPFGKRFNHVWAPIRLVVAMGLLIPVANGLNSAQYITLYAAKFGSSFATNGWVLFFNTATEGGSTVLGDAEKLIATPNAPPMNNLMAFYSLVATCLKGYEELNESENIRPKIEIDAYLINPTNVSQPSRLLSSTNFPDALEYFNHGDMLIRFGHKGDEAGVEDGVRYPGDEANIRSFCGDLRFNIPASTDPESSPGSMVTLRGYYEIIRTQWQLAKSDNYGIGTAMRDRYIRRAGSSPLPTSEDLQRMRTYYGEAIARAVDEGVTAQADSTEWQDDMTKLGWAGAGIWYNKLAQLNGSLMNAVYALPEIAAMPYIMREVEKKRQNMDTVVTGIDRYNPYVSEEREVELERESHIFLAHAFYQTLDMWRTNASDFENSNNIFIDILNAIFGTSGLFNIHDNAEREIHPLAQLTAIGKSLVDSSIMNIGISAIAGVLGGIFQGHMIGSISTTASKFLASTGFMALSIGFVLYYVIPFLPFIYFFIAVGGWVKGIFEAMVGVPLWALAHLRIDGQGLPGDAAMGGYYLILEIFLRPILIIFGLVASILIFAAQAAVLHEIWPLVVSNLTGFDRAATGAAAGGAAAGDHVTGSIRFLRNVIDQIFFTVIYAVVVYMLGMSSFKLIDLIPDHSLHWLGAGVKTFNDYYTDQAENLVRNTMIGSGTILGQMRNMGGQAGQALGGLSPLARRDGE